MAMNSLLDVVRRTPAPGPWQEADKIPWHEPGFSERMLREHLTQRHDAASRRFEKIDAHVDWIHEHVLGGRPRKVLDLGCGPGLYTSRLARRGHDCVGIDYSPASVSYAVGGAAKDGLACRYVSEDIRTAEYGSEFGLVMLINGEFNTFRPADAAAILRKAHDALAHDGLLLLEPHTEDAVREAGGRGPFWYSSEGGLFSDTPHLVLQEHSWDEPTRTATTRYFIVDSATAEVTRHAGTEQAYSAEEYRSLLADAGFSDAQFFPSLTGAEDESQPALFAVVAHKLRAA